ncbi:hypothetical protein [Geodermatophilus amargosae]|uniref:hypothetical protein n=1 Tax=Geodermatophilus amargosae TaxID=1296565 RepID=UPI000B829192|nr:hypothetical protein [Geodermatophilus amargosae]
MDGIFWLGVVCGGLFGLGVDLWKRPLDRLLDRRLEHRASARATAIAQVLAHDRQALRDYLTEVILQTTLVGSLLAILSGIFFGVSSGISFMVSGQDFAPWRPFLATLTVLGQLVAVIGAVYIVRMAGDALTVARKLGATGASAQGGTTP